MIDDLGDRMKAYENLEAGRCLMPLLPTLVRVDGRAFHSFTRGLDRPYDDRFSTVMAKTAVGLLQETNALAAYTQSDEITLLLHSDEPKRQIYFDGRVCKMVSQIAAQATLIFYQNAQVWLPAKYAERNPTFDCRVWQVPSKVEAANVFVWREWDATKNSINMAASSAYSDRELHGKTGSEKQEMLFKKGINWNAYPVFFKRGTYFQKQTVLRRFKPAVYDGLPSKHACHANPNLMVERSEIVALDMPPIAGVKNRVDVLFDGATPEVGQ